jgi:regulatory protein YycI of two-component signal transduction system YycFG
MDFDLSPKMIAVLFIILGVVVVFLLMGGSLQQLLSSSIQENVPVKIKQNNICIVEVSDRIPRSIENCPFNVGDNVTITYKQGLPAIEGFQQ